MLSWFLSLIFPPILLALGQVLQNDATKAISMLKKLAAEPDAEGTPRASKQALIPLDYFKRCKVYHLLRRMLVPTVHKHPSYLHLGGNALDVLSAHILTLGIHLTNLKPKLRID